MYDAHGMLPIHAVAREVLLLLLLAIAGAGCATGYAERYRLAHPDWRPAPPRAGESLEETLASIQTEAKGSSRVSIPELRVLRIDVDPWEPLSLDSVLAGSKAQTIAVIAHRRCKARRGIRFFRSERTSWYVFAAGELVAYDDFEFGEACEPRSHYLPSRNEYLPTEQALIRYAASRYPESAPTTEELLSKGLVLVAAGRVSDAERMLRNADRQIDLLSVEGDASSEDEKEALEAETKRLRAMRARLSRAIAAAQPRKAVD
jgi:hypothetical protein